MKRYFRFFLCVAGILCYIGGYAEQADTLRLYTLYYTGAFGSVASNDLTPFGIVNGRYGKVPLKANNGYLYGSVYHRQQLGKGLGWHAGVQLIASTSRYRNIYLQELYAEVSYKNRFYLSAGSREGRDDGYNPSLCDRQLSSGDLVFSSNARPIPEINFYIPRFLTIPRTAGWLQAKGNFAVGRSFDTDYLESFRGAQQTYVRNVLWHHKSMYLQIQDTRGDFPVSLILGARHFAQWGGKSTHPKLGKQPRSVKDFLRIVAGTSGGSDASISDRINVLGNHYGSYDFRLAYEPGDWSIFGYYQHFFDDRSGMEWYNAWDGLKGIQLQLPRLRWMNKVVVERLSTMDQSGPFHFIEFDHDKYPGYGGGADNYYNNGEYTTGASYFNRSLGSPLLISPEYNTNGVLGFRHNRVRAWHLGIEGEVSGNVAYRVKASSVESFGTPYAPTLRKLTLFSIATDWRYTYRSRCAKKEHETPGWEFGVAAGMDCGSLLGNHWGISFSVTKSGVISRTFQRR